MTMTTKQWNGENDGIGAIVARIVDCYLLNIIINGLLTTNRKKKPEFYLCSKDETRTTRTIYNQN